MEWGNYFDAGYNGMFTEQISGDEYEQGRSGWGEPTAVEEAPPPDEGGDTGEVAPPEEPVVGEIPEDVPVM